MVKAFYGKHNLWKTQSRKFKLKNSNRKSNMVYLQSNLSFLEVFQVSDYEYIIFIVKFKIFSKNSHY